MVGIGEGVSKYGILFCLANVALMNPMFALNIGAETTGVAVSVSAEKECSTTCESSFCSVAPFLRYGKYCGLLYSGCPGERPCDGLDACCMKHDRCVGDTNKGYLSQKCSKRLIKCMNKYNKTEVSKTFNGSTCQPEDVIHVILHVMKAALFAGRLLHRP